MIHAKIVSFTAYGANTGARIAQALNDEMHVEQYARAIDRSLLHTKLSRMIQQAMVDCNLILFIGAVGIAVRMCAPYLKGKQFDPAVIVVDENGHFVIPVLSGHLGGANALATYIADLIGAQPVITTATDGQGAFAVDSWAAAQNCFVKETEQIKFISASILSGNLVGIVSDFPIDSELPKELTTDGQQSCGIVISIRTQSHPFTHTLHVVPKIVHIGIGCRRGVSEHAIESFVQEVLQEEGISFSAICQVASITRKQDELGICCFCQKHQLPFVTYTEQVLQAVPGIYTASDFVKQTVGIDNVCERAAMQSSQFGTILRRKSVKNGITLALAAENWRVQF